MPDPHEQAVEALGYTSASFEKAVDALSDTYINTIDRFDSRNEFVAGLLAALPHLEQERPDPEVVEAAERLADAVRALDSYAALGGAPMERTRRADAALKNWYALSEKGRNG